MIDNNTRFTLLFQKSEKIENKRQRLFTFFYLIPILYYLLAHAVIQEINFSIFNLNKIKIIQFFMPTIYSIIFFYIAVITKHNSEIIEQINKFINPDNEPNQVKIDKWSKYIFPLNFIQEILSIKANNQSCLILLRKFFIYFPFAFFAVLYPIFFFVYSIYFNLKNINQNILLSISNVGFSIWMVISIIIYTKLKDNEKKKTIETNTIN